MLAFFLFELWTRVQIWAAGKGAVLILQTASEGGSPTVAGEFNALTAWLNHPITDHVECPQDYPTEEF